MKAPSDTAAAIEVENLSHYYGDTCALDDLSFRLDTGCFLALLGPNGAGKSTLFSLLTRLLQPSSGSICLAGHALGQSPGKALRHVGVVFQQSTLDLDLSVAQNLAYHGAIQGMARREVKQRMTLELERFDLAHRANDKVRTLNGGHRRRVEIARALLHRPKLLLLDEATAGLDLETRDKLYRYIRRLCRDEGIAVLWTTHLIEELGDEDDTLLLHQGRSIARGTIRELKEQHNATDFSSLLLQLTGAPA